MGEPGFRRICCPVDFSDASELALRAAVVLARKWGADLTLLHVDLAKGSTIPEALFEMPSDAAEDLSAAADRPLEEWKDLAERLGAPRVAVTRSLGQPALEIVEAARRGEYDLIVIGTHGRSGLRRLAFGSVAEEVVRRSPCPVLTLTHEAAEKLAGAG